jgi:hypothetical protein
MGEMKAAYRIVVGKPEGKRQHERPRFSMEDNIKMYLKAIRCKGGGRGLNSAGSK